MRKIVNIISIIISVQLSAQNQFQGLWYKINQDLRFSDEHFVSVKGTSSIEIILDENYFEILSGKVGYVKIESDETNPKSISLDETKDHNMPFFGFKYDDYDLNGNSVTFFYEANGTHYTYERIERLPQDVTKKLHIQSQKDQRDYIAEFLELDVRRVKGDREPLYSDPYTVVDRLSKGTIVRVLGSEQKSGHVQIEYYKAENKVDTGLVIGSFLSTAIQDENGFDKPVASFDCQKSKSVVEQLICSDHHLGLLDIWLNDAYKQAKFFRPKELKSSQRAWIKERNGSIAKEQLPHQQRATLEKLYRERIAFLKEWE